MTEINKNTWNPANETLTEPTIGYYGNEASVDNSIRIAVGNERFEDTIKNNYYYADKTDYIYQLIQKKQNSVTLFTRPRRFGKTLFISMLESFFDIERNSKEVFSKLRISKRKEFCDKWMNSLPVLSVSFKDVEADDYDTANGKLKYVISDICKKHKMLLSSDKVDEADKVIFRRLMNLEGDESAVQFSLKTIMRMMHDYHDGRNVVLLIDEYDVPLAKSDYKEKAGKYYSRMLATIRGIMSTSLKTNDYLAFAVITGCLRIAKESIFTGTNNFKAYSALDVDFSDLFGFTIDDIKELLEKTGNASDYDLLKSWYDGYIMGESEIFCPWDILNYVADKESDKKLEPKNYWNNTSSNDIIYDFINQTDFDVSEKFEKLLNGGTVFQNILDDLTYDSLYSTEDNLWSVLYMTGYLTKAVKSQRGNAIDLKIPNKEIKNIFIDSVVKSFREKIDQSKLNSLMKAFWDGDERTASSVLSNLLFDTISYNDYHEDYYHAVLAGIFLGRSYNVESNKEHGEGRPDLVVKDRKQKRALVIEVKVSKDDILEEKCNEAIKQIKDQRYVEGVQSDDYNVVLSYGISFFRKKALVKKNIL